MLPLSFITLSESTISVHLPLARGFNTKRAVCSFAGFHFTVEFIEGRREGKSSRLERSGRQPSRVINEGSFVNEICEGI